MLSFLCSDFSFSYIVSKMDKNKIVISKKRCGTFWFLSLIFFEE